jgi:hypothetical protein
MLELIYGELGADERAELEGHIAGCADCRAEREGFEQTRALARQVLDEPAPARARAAILAAAAAHATATAPQAAAHAAEAAPARVAPTARPPERRSFWDWVRARWTLPTLATVGAVAVFVLGSRLFLSPDKTYERGRQALAPTPPAEPETAAQTPPAGPAGLLREPPRAQPADELAKDETKTTGAGLAAPEGAPAPASASHHGGKPSLRLNNVAAKSAAAKPAKMDRLDSLLGGSDKGFGVGGSAAGLAGVGEEADRGAAQLKSKDDAKALRREAAAGGEGAARDDSRRFAPPPPPAAAPAKSPAADADSARPLPKAKAKKEISDDPLEGSPPPAPRSAAATGDYEQEASAAPKRSRSAAAGKGAPPPSAPPAASAPVATAEKKSVERKSAPSGAATAKPARPAEAEAPGAKAGRATETPAQRADRLFGEGRWIEAAAAYRELLRSDPRNDDADRWRRRLATAQAEIDAARRPSAPASAAPAN